MLGWLCMASAAPLPGTYTDRTYMPYIGSVEFHPEGYNFGFPTLELNSDSKVLLSFDDLDGDAKNYYYTVVHCNADWTPSLLSDMDYIDGFSGLSLNNLDYSFNTEVGYTHYELTLPNFDLSFKISGNYVLKVFLDSDTSQLVITRRFVVVEPLMSIRAEMRRPFNPSIAGSSHSLSFAIAHQGIPINNPFNEVKVSVLQNGNWNTLITDLKPQFIKENILLYDFADKITFSAYREFRRFSTESDDYATENIQLLERDKTGVLHFYIRPDDLRGNEPYTFEKDINGHFVVDNRETTADETEADYAWVHFTLKRHEENPNGNYYLYAGFTEYNLKDTYKLQYNATRRAYEASVLLKQGYYNYQYVYVPNPIKNRPATLDYSLTEGSFFETENDYQIIAYYRPFGQRYDAAVAMYNINSLRN